LTTACAVIIDTIIVSIEEANAGVGGAYNWCEGSGAIDFFDDVLGGNPDDGGTWFNSDFEEITMPYEPLANQEDIYYVVQNSSCADTAIISISIQNVPVIIASEDTTIFINESVTLLATGGETYSWSPSSGLSCTDCADPVFTAGDSTTFVVTGFDEFGCEDTDSVTVTVILKPFDIPNAFTPNGDGSNDVFNAVFFEGVFVSYHLSIYNRWGELVFESMDSNQGWNGDFQNEKAASDTYIYVLDFELQNGESGIRKGDVTLIR